MATSYEELRQANIDRIHALVAEIGIDITAQTIVTVVAKSKATSKAPRKKKSRPSTKRPREDTEAAEDEDAGSSKAPKVSNEDSSGTRRSSRHAGKPRVDYSKSNFDRPSKNKSSRRGGTLTPESTEDEWSAASDEEDAPLNTNRIGKRTQDPKTFGSIPGIPVGKSWETRMQCSTDAIHAPPVAGISGNNQLGAWSVALSGGYEDDVDLGYAFTFTGAGGRDLKGTKHNPKNLRTAPQSCDQSFDEPLNAALKKSSETKKPVRVIRGYKLKSKYAPASGYRYDGLYTVEQATMERGLSGFMVCKYSLVRVPGQPPIPETSEEADTEDQASNPDDDE